MQIREYRESDLAALRAIHTAQGFDYALPDLSNPLFVTKLVLTDAREGVSVAPGFSLASSDAGAAPQRVALKGGATHETGPGTEAGGAGNCQVEQASACSPILGAALLRLTAEAYLLLDPHAGTPHERWQWLLALHEATRRDAWQRGLEDVHAWLPPPIARKFGRRLTQLGWIRDDAWTPFCKRLTPGS
jgi:hypothetical protein